MTRTNGRRVLAIGLDAAEPALVRRLIEQNQMPALKTLLAEGGWLRVKSPAHIGSGSVWPTFATGKDPLAHGIHGEWCWGPETMSLTRYDGHSLEPFWKAFSEEGISVGVLDPPFVRSVGINQGFEIIDWGPHDMLDGRLHAGPGNIADVLAKHVETHPFASNSYANYNSRDRTRLSELSASCVKGANLRGRLAKALLEKSSPDFALIVFTEIHHASHYLWHTLKVDGDPGAGVGEDAGYAVQPSLEEICREVDRQIAILIEAAAGATIMVFSLHGMRPSAGVPAFLHSLLCEKGFAQVVNWKTQSWPDRSRSLMAAVKRRAPTSLKELYYRTLTPRATKYLAQPTMLPTYDWARTRAFSLPTDQHGWIRINLRGRESAGIVLPEQYEDTCQQLEDLMRGLSTEDGRSLVQQITRTATNYEKARHSKLPDLVVQWTDAACAASSRVRGTTIKIQAIGEKFTGQHAPDGFCILRERNELCTSEDLHAKDMHLLITKLLG